MPSNDQRASATVHPSVGSRAPYYRMLAAEHQSLADRAPTPEQRGAFLKVAADYIELANCVLDHEVKRPTNA